MGVNKSYTFLGMNMSSVIRRFIRPRHFEDKADDQRRSSADRVKATLLPGRLQRNVMRCG
jgi:hypothetical protein